MLCERENLTWEILKSPRASFSQLKKSCRALELFSPANKNRESEICRIIDSADFNQNNVSMSLNYFQVCNFKLVSRWSCSCIISSICFNCRIFAYCQSHLIHRKSVNISFQCSGFVRQKKLPWSFHYLCDFYLEVECILRCCSARASVKW